METLTSKQNMTHTCEFRFNLCVLYRVTYKQMKPKKFLQHEVSGEKISINRSKYQSFAQYIVKHDKGNLEPSQIKGEKVTVYPEVEMKLILCSKLRENLYTQEKFNMGWNYLQGKVLNPLELEDNPKYDYLLANLVLFKIFCVATTFRERSFTDKRMS